MAFLGLVEVAWLARKRLAFQKVASLVTTAVLGNPAVSNLATASVFGILAVAILASSSAVEVLISDVHGQLAFLVYAISIATRVVLAQLAVGDPLFLPAVLAFVKPAKLGIWDLLSSGGALHRE